MSIVTIPDFTATAKPAVADVRLAEKALIEVVGGVHEATRYAGNLDATNVSATPDFLRRQQREPRARLVLSPARWNVAQMSEPVPDSINQDRCVFVPPIAFECDSLLLWHSDPQTLVGDIEVHVDGAKKETLSLPSQGAASGVPIEIPYERTFGAGALLTFFVHDPTKTTYLRTTGGAAPSPYTVFLLHLWGVGVHVR